jgi:hypothetical protein
MQARVYFICIIFLFQLSFNYAHNSVKTETHYYSINGIKLYCEIMGRGSPLVILHGGPGLTIWVCKNPGDDIAMFCDHCSKPRLWLCRRDEIFITKLYLQQPFS